MNLVKCTGKNNDETLFQYTFRVEPIDEPKEVFFTVVPVNQDFDDVFKLSLTFDKAKCLKVSMMNVNNQQIYREKGLPEAMIHKAATIFNMTIVSSSNGKRVGEYRTEPATKVWKRLESRGQAVYSSNEDQYTYIGYRLINKIDPGYENYGEERMQLVQHYIDLPFEDLMKIKPVWDDQKPDQHEIIQADSQKLLSQVDFLGLSSENLFNYYSADHRYADILKRWENSEAVSPGILTLDTIGKPRFSDGRHRTLLACFLRQKTVPVAVPTFIREKALVLIGI
jgi:hypothetical protein